MSGSLGLDATQQMRAMKHLTPEQQTAEAARQFEAVLLQQFLKDALKPMIKGFVDGEGSGNEIYQHFIIQSMADGISKGQGLGFSSALQMQLHRPGTARSETAQ